MEHVKKLYEKLLAEFPTMTSYDDGTLRFKNFYTPNKVLEITINNIRPTDVFMDIGYTTNYENTSLNMFKNYVYQIQKPQKKAQFTYNQEEGIYEIKKVDVK